MARNPLKATSMYRLRVKTTFDAAHNILVAANGKCEKLHGHTWEIELFIIGEKQESNDMVIDFTILKANLQEIAEKLDHTYLNEIEEIGNPTSENIAKFAYEALKKKIPHYVKLEKVRVWESPKSWCEYLG
jgi:6-pyruvoyltetrahydropterin/6-carboxytetrahydropterin synthase